MLSRFDEYPIHQIRVTLAGNDTGLSCDLMFEARSAPIEEDRQVLRREDRVFMDVTRFTQLGRWHGTIGCKADRIAVDRTATFAARDRSWGERPVGEPETGGWPPDRGECGAAGVVCADVRTAARAGPRRLTAGGGRWARRVLYGRRPRSHEPGSAQPLDRGPCRPRGNAGRRGARARSAGVDGTEPLDRAPQTLAGAVLKWTSG